MPRYSKNHRYAYKKVVRRPAKLSRWDAYGIGLNQLRKDVIKVKNLINVEFKNHDVVNNSFTNVSTTGSITALNYVAQGDGEETRDGKMFRMKSLELRYQLSMDTLEEQQTTGIRVIVFLDTDPTGSGPSLSTLLDQTVNPMISPRNLDSRSRYVILLDRIHQLNPNGQESLCRKFYKKLDLKVLFSGATATDATIKKNGLYILFVSDQTNQAKQTFNARIRYIDN